MGRHGHTSVMKGLPAGLPPAHSRRWHARRVWDELGYLRVRSLANPDWPRDVSWLTQVLVRERASMAPKVEWPGYDAAIAAARRYPQTSNGRRDQDAAWDEILVAIDALLASRQRRHLQDVARARSGESAS